MNLLEVNALCKTYGNGDTAVDAVKSVSFSVPKGQFVAVVGESGSGKSTLLNMLGALDTPTSGNVLIDGNDVLRMREEKLTIFRRRNIGFIFQAFNLIPELNVEQNITFPLLLDYKKPDKGHVEEILTVLSLQDRRGHLPGQLSGGQQQRVAIGRALITRPMLILADEPTGNLDSRNSNEVISLLKTASKRYSQTIIMITHSRSVASMADRVLQVSDGVLFRFGGIYRMKSYLGLIPISAKVHRRQNRMTLLCIIFAVFLVTAIFSMADMGVRMEQTRLLDKHGSMTLQDLFSSTMAQTLFLAAAVLFALILIAGVLMISSSLNSNVAQRTQFFGMMRCIGMSKRQIIRFVRLEALNWCKTAVPIGVALGTVITWALCAALRFLVGEEFSEIPLFAISLIGIVSGIVVGIVTVIIAASSPAKRAAKVSLITAVSGNSENGKILTHAVNTRFSKIETALGIHHAVSAKKNLVLMISSFALSIILFLSFSVLIEFVGYLMPQSSNASDIDISSSDGSNSIDSAMLTEIGTMQGVKTVFGRRSLFDVPAEIRSDAGLTDTIDMISFDDFDLDCLTKDKLLRKGSDISKVYGDSDYVLAICDVDSPLEIGDMVQIGSEKLEIAGILRYDPFSSDGNTNGQITIITSSETFTRLTGINEYSLIMIQTTSSATDEDIAAVSGLVAETHSFQDRREQSTAGTYMAFQICVYGFLAIITLVTVLNIMNSISMSVSARINQYGAMRAIGMDEHQITKMIAAEASTYALSGCIVGCVIGLLISKLLYNTLITDHFSYATWSVPVVPLAIILLFVFAAAIIAVYAPSKRIRSISVTETINEL